MLVTSPMDLNRCRPFRSPLVIGLYVRLCAFVVSRPKDPGRIRRLGLTLLAVPRHPWPANRRKNK